MNLDDYTIVCWPWADINDKPSLVCENQAMEWLTDLHIEHGTKSWAYLPGSRSRVAFRDPGDALTFKLMIAGVRPNV